MRPSVLLVLLTLVGCYRSYGLEREGREDGGATPRDAGAPPPPPHFDAGEPPLEPLPSWPEPPPPGSRPSDDPDAGAWRPSPEPGEGSSCCTVSEPREVAEARNWQTGLTAVRGNVVWHVQWNEVVRRGIDETQVLALQRIDSEGNPVGGTTRHLFDGPQSGRLMAYGAGRLVASVNVPAFDGPSTYAQWTLDEAHRVRERRDLPAELAPHHYVYFPFHRGWVVLGEERDARGTSRATTLALLHEDGRIHQRRFGGGISGVVEMKSRLVVLSIEALDVSRGDAPCSLTVLEGPELDELVTVPCPTHDATPELGVLQAARIRDEVLLYAFDSVRTTWTVRFDPFDLRFTTDRWTARPDAPRGIGHAGARFVVEENAAVLGMVADGRFHLTTFDFEPLGSSAALPGVDSNAFLAPAGTGRFAYLAFADDGARTAILAATIESAFAD